MVETMMSRIPENGIIDADELIDAAQANDEDFDYVLHAEGLLKSAGMVLLAQSDDTMDEIHNDTLRAALADWQDTQEITGPYPDESVRILCDVDGVRSLDYQTWNRDAGRNDHAVVYYCDQSGLSAIAEQFRQGLGQA